MNRVVERHEICLMGCKLKGKLNKSVPETRDRKMEGSNVIFYSPANAIKISICNRCSIIMGVPF